MSHSNQIQALLVRKADMLKMSVQGKSAVHRLCLAECMAEIDAEVAHHQHALRSQANVVPAIRIVRVA